MFVKNSVIILFLFALAWVPVLAQPTEPGEELPECPIFEGEPTEVRISYYMGEGLGYLNSSQLNQALFSFTCITRVVDPQYVPAHMNRATINVRLRRYEDALDDFATTLALDSSLIEAVNNRGVVNSILGEYEDAAADFDRAIELDETFLIGYNNRSIIHMLDDEFDEAEALLQRAIDVSGIDDIYTELTDPDRPSDAEDPEFTSLATRAYGLLGMVHSARALESYEVYQFLNGGRGDGRINSAAGALESRFAFELRLDDGSWMLTAVYDSLGASSD